MNNDLTVEQLAQAFLDAKEEEDAAIKRRRDIGALLEAALPGAEEGSTTHKGAALKVSITRKLTRSVDSDALSANWGLLPQTCRDAFKWKAEVNLKHFRAMQELNSPDLSHVQGFLTTKPAAASVSVERINKD